MNFLSTLATSNGLSIDAVSKLYMKKRRSRLQGLQMSEGTLTVKINRLYGMAKKCGRIKQCVMKNYSTNLKFGLDYKVGEGNSIVYFSDDHHCMEIKLGDQQFSKTEYEVPIDDTVVLQFLNDGKRAIGSVEFEVCDNICEDKRYNVSRIVMKFEKGKHLPVGSIDLEYRVLNFGIPVFRKYPFFFLFSNEYGFEPLVRIVFSFLPGNFLIQCCRVCKYFRNIIQNKITINQQVQVNCCSGAKHLSILNFLDVYKARNILLTDGSATKTNEYLVLKFSKILTRNIHVKRFEVCFNQSVFSRNNLLYILKAFPNLTTLIVDVDWFLLKGDSVFLKHNNLSCIKFYRPLMSCRDGDSSERIVERLVLSIFKSCCKIKMISFREYHDLTLKDLHLPTKIPGDEECFLLAFGKYRDKEFFIDSSGSLYKATLDRKKKRLMFYQMNEKYLMVDLKIAMGVSRKRTFRNCLLKPYTGKIITLSEKDLNHDFLICIKYLKIMTISDYKKYLRIRDSLVQTQYKTDSACILFSIGDFDMQDDGYTEDQYYLYSREFLCNNLCWSLNLKFYSTSSTNSVGRLKIELMRESFHSDDTIAGLIFDVQVCCDDHFLKASRVVNSSGIGGACWSVDLSPKEEREFVEHREKCAKFLIKILNVFSKETFTFFCDKREKDQKLLLLGKPESEKLKIVLIGKDETRTFGVGSKGHFKKVESAWDLNIAGFQCPFVEEFKCCNIYWNFLVYRSLRDENLYSLRIQSDTCFVCMHVLASARIRIICKSEKGDNEIFEVILGSQFYELNTSNGIDNIQIPKLFEESQHLRFEVCMKVQKVFTSESLKKYIQEQLPAKLNVTDTIKISYAGKSKQAKKETIVLCGIDHLLEVVRKENGKCDVILFCLNCFSSLETQGLPVFLIYGILGQKSITKRVHHRYFENERYIQTTFSDCKIEGDFVVKMNLNTKDK